MMDKLPLENIHDILSRLSVKSLARLRCVSKRWSKYINDPYFEIKHAKRTSNAAMRIMFHRRPFFIPTTDAPCTLTFLEYKYEQGDNCTLKVTKKPPVLMKFMCRDLCYRYNIILGSCNGLLYSSKYHRDGNNLVVIHPLRNECYQVLPPIKSPFCLERRNSVKLVDESTGLGFDESTNTFKMVSIKVRKQITVSPNLHVKEDACVMVHVLGTDSWRRIPQLPSYRASGEGVFANGCLHWLSRNEHFDPYHPYKGTKLISFDVANEEFGLINPPQGRGSYQWSLEQLVDLHGEIGYVYRVGRNTEVWVMKERGWVMHCEFKNKAPVSYGPIFILGFWNEYGDILFKDYQKRMFVYGLNSKSFYQVMFDDWEEGSDIDIRLYQTSLSSTRYAIKRRYATGVL
ncbi:hypothetical protein QVD17_28104 [Tagetes erecta]|uniref:F-box domain-containing protein n=1 Tax=Tagetes erecta TaxID=13708 RepID=A0AAD8NSE7_TARER|nr:hypothetical protein QVD17_28104 [Tagetes erecta]